MAKLSRDKDATTLHPRENLVIAGALGSLNAEIITKADGCTTVSLDLRGVFSQTVEVSGTVDGVNWLPIPMRPVNVAATRFVAVIAGAVAGAWVGDCSPYLTVRARVTAYTSGASTATLMATNAVLGPAFQPWTTTDVQTITAAAGVAATLTISSPGAGLRHYLTYLRIVRFAAAVLTPAATPVLVTTTNIPGTPSFSFPADAAAQGTVFTFQEDFGQPIAATAQAAATTIVCPATTNVIWRITAGYYVAP